MCDERVRKQIRQKTCCGAEKAGKGCLLVDGSLYLERVAQKRVSDQLSLFALSQEFLFRPVRNSNSSLLLIILLILLIPLPPHFMSFRRVSSGANNSTSYSYSNTAPSPTSTLVPHDQSTASTTPSPTMRKRQRTLDMHPPSSAPSDTHPPSSAPPPPVGDDAFINDHDAADSAGDDDEDEEKPKSDKKAGRRKIKIEFIQDKSRRHITFSKRKAGMSRLLFASTCLEPSLPFSGIMKKVTFLPVIFNITSHTHFRHTNYPPSLVLKSFSSSSPRLALYTPSPPQNYNPSSHSQKARTLSKLVSMHLMALYLHPCPSALPSAVPAIP
jgi:hypothetical protein